MVFISFSLELYKTELKKLSYNKRKNNCYLLFFKLEGRKHGVV